MQSSENNESSQAITNDAVSDFLRQNTHFFEINASLLTELFLPSPHGSGTISLAERQQLAQRDKIRMLEIKLADLISFAEENDTTSKKIHAFTLKLLANHSFAGLVELTKEAMQSDFDVSNTMIRIWLKSARNDLLHDEAFTAVDDAFSDWVLTLKEPYCGMKPVSAGSLLPDDLQSFAIIPLHKSTPLALQPAFGVLILGSDQAQRFKAGMGTMYLERIGELVSAEILNHV